jgi:hypothetical protein
MEDRRPHLEARPRNPPANHRGKQGFYQVKRGGLPEMVCVFQLVRTSLRGGCDGAHL